MHGVNNIRIEEFDPDWEFASILEERLADFFTEMKLDREYFKLMDVMETRYHCYIVNNHKAYEERLWAVLPSCFFYKFLNKHLLGV